MMFRFYNSSDYPGNLNWKVSKGTTFEAVVERYYRDHCYVHDADNCGDEKEFIAVRSESGETRYFELKWDWYIDRNTEEYIFNNHEIIEVTKAEASNLVEDRDWMKLNRHGYNKAKWPPVPEASKESVHA